jgi:predicted permease
VSIHEIRNGVMRLVRLPLRARRDIDADADAELRSFLAERVESLRAQGMSDTDAEREALRRLGSSLDDATHLLHHSARSRERRMNMRELYDDFTQDLHYAIRTLRRDLRFAVFAIVIVGLGIGASVTVFSVANAMLIRPLPFTNPDRLVWMPNSEAGGLSGQTSQVNSVLRVMENNQSFDAISGYFAFSSAGDTKLLEKGQVVRLSGLPVMRNFFDVLGVKPLLGRGFTQEEATGKGPAAVMLSHSLWSVRYNADPQIVGKSLVLGGNPTTIVGVLPESFNFGAVFVPGTHIDLFTPFPMEERQNGWGNTLSLVGRLKAGVTPAAASAELKVIAARLLVENPRMNTFKPRAIALREHVSGTVRSALIVLTLAVGVVMLIVCANLSNLLLARATTRQKEMAVRVALGAGRARLVRQMLTESVVLSACGTVLGLLLAVAGTRVIASLDGINLPMLSEVRIDLAAVGIATLLALVAGIAFGLVPALQIPSGAVHGALKESTRNATGGSRGKVARSSLVISEIALACVLLVGAGLLTRSFFKVLDIDMGFKAQQVASIRVDPTSTQTGTAEAFTAYVDEVLRVVRETPGVVAAGLSDGLPLTGNRSWGVAARESGYADEKSWKESFVHVVSDGYFAAMQTPIKRGRDFTPQDVFGKDRVVVINESLAKALWPGQGSHRQVHANRWCGVASDRCCVGRSSCRARAVVGAGVLSSVASDRRLLNRAGRVPIARVGVIRRSCNSRRAQAGGDGAVIRRNHCVAGRR